MKNLILTTFLAISFVVQIFAQKNNYIDEIKSTIYKVDSTWQTIIPKKSNAFWDKAVFHMGNIAVYDLLQDTNLLSFTKEWTKHNVWRGTSCTYPAIWEWQKMTNKQINVLNANYITCFQVYIDLSKIENTPEKIKYLKYVIKNQMERNDVSFWYWTDALFMEMPVLTKLWNLDHNPIYLDKMFQYFTYMDNKLYDQEYGLYYRDEKYISPRFQTPNKLKDFWSRGNGWVFSAFAMVLSDIPDTCKHYQVYKERYIKMAQTLKKFQTPGGWWNNSIIDTSYTSGMESTGTALNIYALCKGINSGLLKNKNYKKTIKKAWDFVYNQAITDNNKMGYIFDLPEWKDIKYVPRHDYSRDYATGIFLLAATEYVKYRSQSNKKKHPDTKK